MAVIVGTGAVTLNVVEFDVSDSGEGSTTVTVALPTAATWRLEQSLEFQSPRL